MGEAKENWKLNGMEKGISGQLQYVAHEKAELLSGGKK